MKSFISLIGSIMIGGLLLLSLFRFNAAMTRESYEKVFDSSTFSNAAGISSVIEFDFNRMGLGVPRADSVIIEADSNRITFLSDIDKNGAVDTVRYFLSGSSDAIETDNPRDRILYRQINNEQLKDAALGVTNFLIRYLNSLSNETADLKQMKTFEITLTVESTMHYDGEYSNYTWQTKITPPNLLR